MVLSVSNLNKMIGKVIIFNKKVEKTEIDFDSGMKARIEDWSFVYSDSSCIEFNVDFSEFEKENQLHMIPNYYDKNGDPTLRWKDMTWYPKDFKETIYIENNKGELCFNVEGE